MSSLVERLRVRSDRKPIYNIDESDDDADLLPGKRGTTQEKFERIVRTDAVCFFYLFFLLSLIFCLITVLLLFFLLDFIYLFYGYSFTING